MDIAILVLLVCIVILVKKRRASDPRKTETLIYVREEDEQLTWQKKLKWWTWGYWVRWR